MDQERRPVGHSAYSWHNDGADSSSVPLGHSAYSWGAGAAGMAAGTHLAQKPPLATPPHKPQACKGFSKASARELGDGRVARVVAEPPVNAASVLARRQWQQDGGGGGAWEGTPTCALWRVSDAGNIGTMLRTMACLNFRTMVHVTKTGCPSDESTGFAERLACASRGAAGKDFVARERWSPDAFVGHCAAPSGGARLPIVAVETGPSAVSMVGFDWPERCTILVGSEGLGIHGKVLEQLRPGFDSLVIIPTPGAHKSFNVAMAFGMALYSYRQQWPGMDVDMDMDKMR